jgi:hypothetical protein
MVNRKERPTKIAKNKEGSLLFLDLVMKFIQLIRRCNMEWFLLVCSASSRQ